MILVTGGAGYIGSHAVKMLIDEGESVIVIDNLSTGHEGAVDKRAILKIGDISDQIFLDTVFRDYEIESVLHFAANCYVGESVVNPLKYYNNNVSGTISLLSVMLKHNVKKIIFSSTCAVYGIPNAPLISENTPTNPINPYGYSKLMMEQVIKDLSQSNEMEYFILRYFNVAGASPDGQLGEDHEPETHLIPNVLFHLLDRIEQVTVFGNDYETDDGTCIRDYIHVNDLVHAHILALKELNKNKIKNKIYNVGNERGYSVNEVIKACETISGRTAGVIYQKRRAGDPPKLVSSSKLISQELGWKPRYTLKDMIQTSWDWFSRFPSGY